MSIRLRLTLWYTALLGASMLLFGLLFYSFLDRVLRTELEDAIRSQAGRATAVLERELDPFNALRSGRIPLPTTIVFADQVYAQVVALPSGSIVGKSSNLGDLSLPLPGDILWLNLQGRSVFYTWEDAGIHLRIISVPVRAANKEVVGAMLVAQSLQGVERMLRATRLVLLGSSILALLLAAVVGAFLAHTALRPIDEITRTARRISQREDLSERLAVPAPPHDEVGRLAATFNEMLERLQRLFEAQQRLVADVSHELRTPLTTVRGNLDLLRRGALEDPASRKEALDAIEGEIGRMSRLVSDLLLLAQADAGIRLDLKPVELDTILLDVYRQAQIMAAGTGVQVHLGNEDQAVVRGDADRLRQLLLNLVENGIKYTPAGGKVTLSLYRDNDWVQVSVADTGIGIAPEDLPHIFERFYRGSKRRAQGRNGIGLGLAIARWLAEAHGGQLTVASRLGEGSTFTLWLPLYRPA